MKQAWLVKYDDSEWEIKFEEPESHWGVIIPIAYVELRPGEPDPE